MSEAPEPVAADLVAALADADAHPEDASAGRGVDVVQTHLSWVFLTGERVYKLRKAVDLPFARFGARAERNADCLREVALNRRLSPDVYLGVAPLLRIDGRWRVGAVGEALAETGQGPTPEHCVVMRRLPGGRDALSLLESGELGAAHLDAVAALVAAFHARVGLGRPAPFGAEEWRARVAGPVLANFASLAESALPEIDPGWLARVEGAARAWLEAAAGRIEARRSGMRIVDGHGDLHLAHVWFEAGPERPLLVDCIEFNEDLRRIDAASEVAFLAMDLAYRGRFRLAERFLRVYAREADDFGLYGVVDGFASYRAAVRAKVAALAVRDPAIEPAQRAAATRSAADHLALAEALLRPRRGGALVLTCGIVGTGKSTVAEALADATGGAVISSDRTRKRLAGLAATARAGAAPEGGIYDRARSDATYAGLLERAAPVVAAGRTAVLDATYAQRARREAARAWAAARGVPALLVEVRCRRETALGRLARREAEGRDPSDAGPALYDFSAAGFEATDEWPRPLRVVASTEDPGWREALAEVAARVR